MGTKSDHNAPLGSGLPAKRVLAVGDTFLDGRFHLVEPIGKGDFGVAWVAHDPVQHSEATLKYLLDCTKLNEVEISKFCEETKWTLFQNQPNIVRVFDLQQPSAASDLVQRLIDLPEAETASKKGTPFFDVAEIQDWIKLICETLIRVHRKKAREVTKTDSQNQVFVRENQTENSDFEVSARVTETVTRLTGIPSIFTNAYGSPEQALGAAFHEKQDVYAVGALIYDLLTGRPPFFRGDVLSQIQQVKPPSMTERRREFQSKGALIPQRWEETVASCLSKDPARRPDFDGLITHLFKEAGPVHGGKKSFSFTVLGIIALGAIGMAGLSVKKRGGVGEISLQAKALVGVAAPDGGRQKATPTVRVATEAPAKPLRLDKATLPPVDQVLNFAPSLPNPPQIVILPEEMSPLPPVRAERVFASILEPEPKPLPLAPAFLPPEPVMLSPDSASAVPESVSAANEGESFLLEDIGMEMIWIQPLRTWVAKSEVTQEQFARGGGKAPRKFQGSERAHDSVTWFQAMKFCEELTAREKQKNQLPSGFIYTLPTEEQWEVYVGNAGLEQSVFGGLESSGPSAPGTKPANEYGLVDVRGNLWEWTQTDYSPANPAKGKALRGGSYVSSGSMVMNDDARFYGEKDNSYFQYGFRFVLTPGVTPP